MRRLLVLLMLLCPSLALAQGGAMVSGITIISSSGRPVAGATVSICTAGGTGIPCTPLASIFSDPALTIPKTNPATTDGNGNVFVYAAPGTYKYTVTGTGGISTTGQPFTATVAGSGGGNVVTGAPQTFTALQTFAAGITGTGTIGTLGLGTTALGAANAWTGNETHTGLETFCDLGQTKYVGGSCTAWAGGDILAKINSAYGALPATGGEIVLLPQSSGACYSANTTVNFTTSGKYVTLRGLAAPNQSSGQVTGGSCIMFTHVGAVNMINVDSTPGSGGGYVANAAFQNIALVNSSTEGGATQCQSIGGCGSSAVAINLGAANAGAHLSNWQNLSVKGFGTGMANVGTAGVGWGGLCVNCSFAYNVIGTTFNGTEGFTFLGGTFSVNGTGVKLVAGSVNNLKFMGTHWDSNTTLGLDGTVGTCGVVEFVGNHWENLGTLVVAYVNCSNGAITFDGGDAQDDSTSGGAAAYWFTGASVNIEGLSISAAAGRTPPLNLFVANTALTGNLVNGSPANLPTANLGLTSGGSNVTVSFGGPTLTSTTMHSRARFPCITLPGGTTGFADLTCDTVTPALKLSNNDAYSQISRFVDMGRVYNDAGSQQASPHLVVDGGNLSSGTPSTLVITLAGSAVFTNGSSYKCGVTNQTTQANSLKITYTDGSHFTITGPNTVTDAVGWVCAGN